MSTTSLIVFAVLFVVFFPLQWWRMRSHSVQNPEWRDAMKSTSWRDRRRIAQAVRDGKRLDNPREAQLAVGMAEQQQVVNRSLAFAPKLKLILGVGLILLGLLAGVIAVAALGGMFLLLGIATRAHEKRFRQRLARAEEMNREQASLEGGPVGD